MPDEEYILDGIRRLYEKGHRRIAFLPLKSRSNTNLKLKSKAETKFTGLRLILQIPYFFERSVFFFPLS